MTSLKTRSSDGTSYESICPECRDGFSAKLRDGKWIYHSWSVDAVRADVEKSEDTRSRRYGTTVLSVVAES